MSRTMAMPSTPIQALDERNFPYPAEAIWSVLADVTSFPDWSPPSVKVTVLKATSDLVGTRFEIHPRGGRTFQCEVESAEVPRTMRMRYPDGLITGSGEWRLKALDADHTRVIYAIDVVAHGWLAAILGSLINFPKFHSKVMRDILTALEQETLRRSRDMEILTNGPDSDDRRECHQAPHGWPS